MPNQELNVIILPSGELQLDWNDSTSKINKSTQALQKEIFNRYQQQPESWLLTLGFCDSQVTLSPSLGFWRTVIERFTKAIIQTPDLERVRHQVRIKQDELNPEEFVEKAPLSIGSEYLSKDLITVIWNQVEKNFKHAIKKYQGTVETFIHEFSPATYLIGRVFFHLVENKKSDDPFAFLATYSTGLNQKGESKHMPLKYALQEYGEDQKKLLELLTTVYTAAKQSQMITEIIDSGEIFYPLAWSAQEAFTFLQEVPIYEDAGILCRIPNWWKGKKASLRINVNIGGKTPSHVGLGALLDFEPELMLGDTKITEEEARQLLNQSEGLAFIKNKWVTVDREKLEETLAAYQQAQTLIADEGLTLSEALRLQLNPQKLTSGPNSTAEISITHGAWLKQVFEQLKQPATITKRKVSRSFKAELRKYQQFGLNWLGFLNQIQLGACLADDMGLGKTIQLLAFLVNQKEAHKKKPITKKASLLVLPASLIANWSSEIDRFAPDLEYYIAHASGDSAKGQEGMILTEIDAFDLVITTYGLVKKTDWIKTYSWKLVILDEAQAIKNPGSQQTKAVKLLKANHRIAMTGTPIENRLGDLWSLFDFLNPGLLGNAKEFGQMVKRLKENPEGYTRLRKVIQPFILRRMKTDPTIISDLPEKVEMKTWAPLVKKQLVLYTQILKEIKEAVQETEGIQRKGMILSALTKFKQLCNHPDQYLGTGDFDPKHSGKFKRLREICETIYEKRERVLVFTQFKEMTEPLAAFLTDIFQQQGLVLHGSTPVKKRKTLIEQFQAKAYTPFMVLSLKAGGVGLNLTEANHVIHFDRWWNPAVENQATDRAFRIGQKKNVVVHKFITKGTIEEKIDHMLEEKMELSENVIADSNQNWITEMSNKELLDAFSLKL
jgi:SNF2 family DNA or RNA helicase